MTLEAAIGSDGAFSSLPPLVDPDGTIRTRIFEGENRSTFVPLYANIASNLRIFLAANESLTPRDIIILGDNIVFGLHAPDQTHMEITFQDRPEYDFTIRELIERTYEDLVDEEGVDDDLLPEWATGFIDLTTPDSEAAWPDRFGMMKSDRADRVISRHGYRVLGFDNGHVVYELKYGAFQLGNNVVKHAVYRPQQKVWSIE